MQRRLMITLGGGGTFFYLQAVNGQKVQDNALQASVRASRFREADLVIQQMERAVPAGKVRLSITAQHAYAAPVQSMSRSEAPPVEQEVDVELRAGQRYRVSGALYTCCNPRQRLARYAPDVQAAIRAGKVKPGMTREQVIMSLGYPRSDLTASLGAEQWRYNTLDEQEFAVAFGPADTVVRVGAGPD